MNPTNTPRDNRANAPYDIYDYDVLDRNGRRIGPLTGFWVDEATNKPEFASVKTGWLMGKNHVIPIRDAQIDHGNRAIRIQYEERLIRDAPGFAVDQDLSSDEEDRVYQHYGLQRSLRRSPTGLPRGGPATGAAGNLPRGELGRGEAGRTEEIPLHEERVDVGKRQVEEGVVRLRKVVRTEVRDVPVELRRERVDIERVPASELRGTSARGPGAFQEEEITMRERREEPVIEKSREVVGGVRATTREETERENVRTETRREDVEVDRDDETRRG